MKPELTNHVQREMDRRGIPLAVVESVLAAPPKSARTRRCGMLSIESRNQPEAVSGAGDGERDGAPPKVVTVYRTSKISKYWKATT